MSNLSFHVKHYGDNTFTVAVIDLTTDERLGYITVLNDRYVVLNANAHRIPHSTVTGPEYVINLYKKLHVPIKEEVFN